MIDIDEVKRLCQIECRNQDAEWESYQQFTSRDMLALIERLEAAERDSVKYRALLASAGDKKPESLAKLLPPDSRAHYVRPDTIHQYEAAPDVQMAAHILVSERHGKFDLIHLVAYLIGVRLDDSIDRHAARYRWLRAQSHLSLVVVDRSPEHIDALVDEMMGEPT